ncbi:hypothetical protein QVD17_34875 [Tagetes erecta]|uniref:DUF659 domain-containing protein n=1 Tax=Tagetes erecta TaxID=13708 RepID=A0AAD8JYB2_TARER|nr:hypothetical protein QVD17_34875 [Tagetes erecta]
MWISFENDSDRIELSIDPGKRVNTQQEEDNETHISDTQGAIDVDDDDVVETNASSESQATGSSGRRSREKSSEEKDANKPLIAEVTFNGADVYNMCIKVLKSGLAIIVKSSIQALTPESMLTFLGQEWGKTDIKRCPTVLRDRELYYILLKKVKDAENSGVSKCLKPSYCQKLEHQGNDLKNLYDTKENRAPEPPSCENARTTLLDMCIHDVEKELAPVKDTWYTQGVSIISDGLSNVKHKPLINVLAVNSRGAMFMEAQDFSRVVKTGEEIASYLIWAIEK